MRLTPPGTPLPAAAAPAAAFVAPSSRARRPVSARNRNGCHQCVGSPAYSSEETCAEQTDDRARNLGTKERGWKRSRRVERTRGTRIAAGTAFPGLAPSRTQARRNGSAWILARVVKGTCDRLGTSTSASCAAGWRLGSVQARGMSAIVDHTSTSIDPGRTIGRTFLSNRSCPYQTSGLNRTALVGRSGEPGEPRPIPAAGHNRIHNLGERGVPTHLLGGVKPAQRLPRCAFRHEGVLSPRGGFRNRRRRTCISWPETHHSVRQSVERRDHERGRDEAAFPTPDGMFSRPGFLRNA